MLYSQFKKYLLNSSLCQAHLSFKKMSIFPLMELIYSSLITKEYQYFQIVCTGNAKQHFSYEGQILSTLFLILNC